jgi:uncharacterized protein (DUF427 family)
MRDEKKASERTDLFRACVAQSKRDWAAVVDDDIFASSAHVLVELKVWIPCYYVPPP